MKFLRLLAVSAIVPTITLIIAAFSHHSVSAAQGAVAIAAPASCGESSYSAMGVTYEVRFAKNGAVQQYLLARSSHNTEKDHDVLKNLQARYGPEGVNAPPLQITSFRPGTGGMMIPDKAVDSCGRVVHFH